MDQKEKIKSFPATPGVYIFKDSSGGSLYIGKAVNLRKRVFSYFRNAHNLSDRISLMVSQARDITYIPTSTEAEALIYENGLIKELNPKYNVALKDGKSYPLLKLTVNEEYPRLFITRQKKDDGALYFGPYSNVSLLREAVSILRKLFPLRKCSTMKKKVCLDFHIGQCLGPCEGRIDKMRYDELVNELRLFLSGRKEELLKLLTENMKKRSSDNDFEQAAEIRNRLEALSSVKEHRVKYAPGKEADELKDILSIKGKLETIEAFDVSNIMGKQAVGSMVHFYKGRPNKSEYKRFKIKFVKNIDDYAMIREIVGRRYRRLVEEKKDLPDLIIIDGGLGHLNAALVELRVLGLEKIPIISIAKEFEHIFCKDKKDPIILPRESKALHLIERIRDEAHRFAISYHKHLKSKDIVKSELDGVPGVGLKRKKALMSYFSSIDAIKSAGVEELCKVDGMDEKTAKNIIEYFKK